MLISCQLTHSLGTLCSTLSLSSLLPRSTSSLARCLFRSSQLLSVPFYRRIHLPHLSSSKMWSVLSSASTSAWLGAYCLDRRSSSAMPTACLTHIGREMQRKKERERESVSTYSSLPCCCSVFFSALSLSLFSVINTYTETFICLCMYMLHFFTVIVPRINTIPFDPPYDPLSCRAALPFECINRCVFLLFSN